MLLYEMPTAPAGMRVDETLPVRVDSAQAGIVLAILFASTGKNPASLMQVSLGSVKGDSGTAPPSQSVNLFIFLHILISALCLSVPCISAFSLSFLT